MSSTEHPWPKEMLLQTFFQLSIHTSLKDSFIQQHLRQIDPSHLVRIQCVKEGNKFSSAKTEVLSASKNFTRSWFFFQPQGQVLLLLA